MRVIAPAIIARFAACSGGMTLSEAETEIRRMLAQGDALSDIVACIVADEEKDFAVNNDDGLPRAAFFASRIAQVQP